MTSHYLQTVFTPAVKAAQEANGSRAAYARHDDIPTAGDRLSENERAFIEERDSFYMGTVTETGWPYIQHRGGPVGFLKAIDDHTLGFADYRGNRQYVSIGNAAANDKVSLFLMDYPNRARLKILGRMRIVDAKSDPALAERLKDPNYKAAVEHLILIDVEAFDWNCSQHITPRFTVEDITPGIKKLQDRIAELEADLARRA